MSPQQVWPCDQPAKTIQGWGLFAFPLCRRLSFHVLEGPMRAHGLRVSALYGFFVFFL